jgi:ATP-dependent DNA ligase
MSSMDCSSERTGAARCTTWGRSPAATLRRRPGLAELLSKLHAAQSPFADPPAIQRFIFWVRPEVVCQVRFSHWSPQGRLRFPVFMTLRPDLSPDDCTADEVAPSSTQPSPLL